MSHFPTRTGASPASIDIDIPLRLDTDNVEEVARLVHQILGGIAAQTAGRDTSQQDIAQALTIAAALHSAIGKIGERTGRPPALSLQQVEVASRALN